MFTQINGMKIHYIEQGTGPDVLLLHGWGASSESFKGIMSSLSDRCHLVAIDFPGCGESDLPKTALNIDDYVDLVLKFCESLGLEAPILIGHSHGCRVIMKLCGTKLMEPKKIVMLGGAGIKPRFNLKKEIKIKTFKAVKGFLGLPFFKKNSEELINKARVRFGSADYSSAPEVMRKTMVNLINQDMTPYIPEIIASTLLVWGENDTATPIREAKIIENGVSGSTKLHIIKDAGHWAMVEKPAEVLGHIAEFLDV